MLHHYTKDRGMIGIIRSQALHARDTLSLNDERELTYALDKLFRAAARLTLERIPPHLLVKAPDDSAFLTELATAGAEAVKKALHNSGPHERLYVTSFAQGDHPEDDERGLLTLFERYGDFCLQYSRQSIEALLEKERGIHSYHILELIDVKYDIDEKSPAYIEIVAELSFQLYEFLYQRYGGDLPPPDYSQRMPSAQFTHQLLVFCGSHKDKAFRDEREVRIFLMPSSTAHISQGRVALSKRVLLEHIYQTQSYYLILGDSILPGIAPQRIIEGPKSNWKPQYWLDVATMVPKVIKSNIPIR